MPDSLPYRPDRKAPALGLRAAQTAEPGVPGVSGGESGQRLAAPPRDVGRLLAKHDTSLPHYLDTNRWREVERSQNRWPLLLVLRARTQESGS